MAKRAWPQRLDAAIKKKLGVKTDNYWNLIAMRYVTSSADGKTPLSDEIHAFIGKWMNDNVPKTEAA